MFDSASINHRRSSDLDICVIRGHPTPHSKSCGGYCGVRHDTDGCDAVPDAANFGNGQEFSAYRGHISLQTGRFVSRCQTWRDFWVENGDNLKAQEEPDTNCRILKPRGKQGY